MGYVLLFSTGGFDPIGWLLSRLPLPAGPPLSPEAAAQRAIDQAYDKFAAGLSVRRLGQSYAFEISYRALTPAKAAKLANSITAAYIRDQVTLRCRGRRSARRRLSAKPSLRRQHRVADRCDGGQGRSHTRLQ